VRKVTLKLNVAFQHYASVEPCNPIDNSDWRFLLREGTADWHNHF